MYCQWGLPLLKYGGMFYTFLQYSIPLPLLSKSIKSNQYFVYMRQWFNFIGNQKNIHIVTQSL
jgi:hypothetical protein